MGAARFLILVLIPLLAGSCRSGKNGAADPDHATAAGAFVAVLAPGLPPGSLIARTMRFVEGEPVRRLAFWRTVKRGLVESVPEADFLPALGADRRLWPPQTVQFSVLEASRTRALLDARFLYQRGLVAGSRGGRVERIRIRREAAGWIIQDRETLRHSD